MLGWLPDPEGSGPGLWSGPGLCSNQTLPLLPLQAVSIMGEEVFSFKLSLFAGATEGEGYGDMSKVDGKVTMRLGCIQIIYLHKFLMSLLVNANANTSTDGAPASRLWPTSFCLLFLVSCFLS